MHAAPPPRSRQRGFTLMELMVAVVIVGILAAIALPSYRSYVLRANRALARATLVDIAARLEVEALRTRAYPSNFDFYINDGDASSRLLGEIEIGLESDGKLTEEGEEAESSTSIYSIKMSSDSTSFLLRAIAQNGQKDDTECRELHLSSTGLRSARPDNHLECWSR